MTKNAPEIWQQHLPRPAPEGHKYDRGHVCVVGGKTMNGAACLAAEAAMRSGAGLCTFLCPPEAMHLYQSFRPYLMAEPVKGWTNLINHLEDERRNAVVIGPGLADVETLILQELICHVLDQNRISVVDGSGLSAFAHNAAMLFRHCHGKAVLTPHEGEFAKLFPGFKGNKQDKAREAAHKSGTIIVLKGHETVIAAPDGRVIINDHASPYLATAGAGDVLAGMIAGLGAQGMEIFDAACAAVWMHGEAGLRLGAGMVSADIAEELPEILREIV